MMRRDSAGADDRGSALVISMLVMLAMSVVAGSLMLLSVSETYGGMNYRLMTQARYSAESGIQKAANYLINSYAAPADGGTDPITAYVTTTSPVTVGGAPVVLSATTGVASTYPIAAVQTAFANAASGSLAVGSATVNYSAYATLLSMRQVDVYGSTIPATIQTWQITAIGTTPGARSATVEVSAVLERQILRLYDYGVFATNDTCGSLVFGGGAVVDSYDSQSMTYSGGTVVTQQYGGNIGSNGNLNENGHATTIYGSMSTPRTGVGNCAANGVDAWTDNGGALLTGGLITLPQPMTYPTPPAPNPLPPTTTLALTKNSTCTGITGCTAGTPDGLVLPPGTYGDLNLTGQAVIHLTTGVYVINSLSMAGNSTVIVDSGPVVLNVAGQNQATPIDFSGGTVTNATHDPSLLQVLYAGTGTLKMVGGSNSSGMVYAPNATVSFHGGSDWYGGVIAKTVNDSGGTSIHNDRQVQNEFFSIGNFMLSAFTWKKS